MEADPAAAKSVERAAAAARGSGGGDGVAEAHGEVERGLPPWHVAAVDDGGDGVGDSLPRDGLQGARSSPAPAAPLAWMAAGRWGWMAGAGHLAWIQIQNEKEKKNG